MYVPITSALGKLRRKDHEFKASLRYIVRLSINVCVYTHILDFFLE